MGAVYGQRDGGGATNGPSSNIDVLAPTAKYTGSNADHLLPKSGDIVVACFTSTDAVADSTKQITDVDSGASALTILQEAYADGILNRNYCIAIGGYGGDIDFQWTSGLQTYTAHAFWVACSGDSNAGLSLTDSDYTSGTSTSFVVPTLSAVTYDGALSLVVVMHGATGGGPGSSMNDNKPYGLEVAGSSTGETRNWMRTYEGYRAGDVPGGETLTFNANSNYIAWHFLFEDSTDQPNREAIHPIAFPTGDTIPAAAASVFGGGISIL